MSQTHRRLHALDIRRLVLFACLNLGGTHAIMAQTQTAPADAPTNTAVADSAEQQALAIFHRADVNADGALTREETPVLPAVHEQFDLWDHDSDGRISQQEFLNAARAARR